MIRRVQPDNGSNRRPGSEGARAELRHGALVRRGVAQGRGWHAVDFLGGDTA
jgi:hypothetical protein